MERRGFESWSAQISLLFVAALLFGLAGCGGGGSPQTTPVKLTISWAARRRVVDAPSSALSAIVTLSNANPAGGDFTWTIDRNSAPAAYTSTYTSTSSAKAGSTQVTVRFYAQAGGQGAVVGIAQATVTINADGTGIGDIATIGTITSVVVTVQQSIAVGQTSTTLATATAS